MRRDASSDAERIRGRLPGRGRLLTPPTPRPTIFPMPANLTPDYLKAEERFKQARAPEEKVAALEQMLSTLPKHKGTEKMQADIRRRLSKLRAEKQKKGGPQHAAPVHLVEREGAGQVALVGPPNSGKSALLARLTHATPVVADYPFSTRVPQPGMMPFENIQIQLVDLPPLHPDFPEAWLPQTIRNADAVALVVNLGDAGVLDQLSETLALLEQGKLSVGEVTGEAPRGLPRASAPGGPASGGESRGLARKPESGKPALLIGNQSDRPGARENFEVLEELWRERFRQRLAVSAATGENLEALRRALFDLLGVVRVYTKQPGKKADLTAPYVLPRGAMVRDVAARVHKDIAAHLKFARLWGGTRFDGQRVEREHVVDDQDVIELHA